MDLDSAREIAKDYVRTLGKATGEEVELIDDFTRTEDFGWVFFYESKRYRESGEIRYALAGNAPIIITGDGRIHTTGTARPIEEYIGEFKRYGRILKP